MNTTAPASTSSSAPRCPYRLARPRRTLALRVAVTEEERRLIADRALENGFDSSASYVRAMVLSGRGGTK